MELNKHGINIGIERIGNNFYLSMKAYGKLTHGDYEQFIPAIEANLNAVEDPHIKAVIDITEFDGWEIEAAWDDIKFGLEHNSEFDKIAIIGSKQWHKIATSVVSWFTSGEIQYFEDIDEALGWI